MSSPCILLAEDDETTLGMMLDMLSIRGYRVVVARNGREAVEQTVEARPDLVLMDMRMPVMTGVEATARIRAMPEFANLPIIALTASTGSEAQAAQMEAGCTAHLPKPLQTAALFEILERHLSPPDPGTLESGDE